MMSQTPVVSMTTHLIVVFEGMNGFVTSGFINEDITVANFHIND